jgi:two-component system, NarL family, response regulator DesR
MEVSRVHVQLPIRVLVAEDNADLRGLLVSLLNDEEDMTCVASVSTVSEIWPKAISFAADVIVLDVELNGESGITAIRERPRGNASKVLVFSGHSHSALIEQTLNAGACAFVLKSSDPQILLSSIRRCAGFG